MQNLKHVHSTQDTFLTSKALNEVVPGHQAMHPSENKSTT